jgi:predicted GTPase
VLVVEDGPTLTHGGMAYGAGYVAALAAGAAAIIDPRAAAAPELRRVFDTFPHIGQVLPAVGYNAAQLQDLEATINRADADIVVSGTPFDLGRLLRINKPIVRTRYEFCETGELKLSRLVDAFLDGVHP